MAPYRVVGEELDGARGVVRDGHVERVRVGAQLLEEAFLHLGCFVTAVKWDLVAHKLHLLAEVDAHHFILLAAETVSDGDLEWGGVGWR